MRGDGDMEKLQEFMYFLMKEARRDSLIDWLEERDISEVDYENLCDFFKTHGVDLNK